MQNRSDHLRRTLPARHRVISGRPWIPWKWISEVHHRFPDPSLITLFDAYRLVFAVIDLDHLYVSRRPSLDANPCWRCGWCCAHINPGEVPLEEYKELARERALICRFLRPEPGPPPVPRFYRPWYYREAPLKMCPFLFAGECEGGFFCAVHERHCGHRPAACREFAATPPHCELPRRPLVY